MKYGSIVQICYIHINASLKIESIRNAIEMYRKISIFDRASSCCQNSFNALRHRVDQIFAALTCNFGGPHFRHSLFEVIERPRFSFSNSLLYLPIIGHLLKRIKLLDVGLIAEHHPIPIVSSQ